MFAIAPLLSREIMGCRKPCASSGMDLSIPWGNYKLSRGWVEISRTLFILAFNL